MAEFVLTDLPRELSESEAAYLTSLCSDAIRRWDVEGAQPVHVCKRKHGGPLELEPDHDESGKAVLVDGQPRYTRRHRLEARCHDCGRPLARPPGYDEERWVCPAVLSPASPDGGEDTALECGEKR